jgi:hypothetical protein
MLKVIRRFGGICNLHLEQAWNQHEVAFLPASWWLSAWLIFRHWRWRRYVPPKHQLSFNWLHGVVSDKREISSRLFRDLPHPYIILVCSVTYPGFEWLIRRVFWIWWSNLLGLYTTGYNSSEITIWYIVVIFRLDTPRKLFWLPTELSIIVGFSLYNLGSDHSTENISVA